MAELSTRTPKETLSGDEDLPILSGGQFRKTKIHNITARSFFRRIPRYPMSGRALGTLSKSLASYQRTIPGNGGFVNQEADAQAYGTKLFKLNTGANGIGTFAVIRDNDIGFNANCVGKWIGFDCYSPNPDAINDVQFYLGVGTGMTHFYKWNNVLGNQSVRPMQYGRRTRIAFPVEVSSLGALGHASSFSGTNTDLSNVRSWQVRIDAKDASTPAELWVDRVFVMDPPEALTCVTMDDGYKSWWDYAKPILDDYQIRTTINAIQAYHDPLHPEWTGQPANRLSETDLATFIDQGHELAFHLKGNHAGEDYTPTFVREEAERFKEWAYRKFKVDVLTMAYPGGEAGYFKGPNYPVGHAQAGQPKPGWLTGDDNITVREVVADFFPICRTIARVSPESLPAADETLIKCFLYQYGDPATPANYTSPATNLGYLNTLAASKGVGVWSFHDIVPGAVTAGVTTQYNVAEFEQCMANILTAGVRPVTMTEAFL